jgi:uncharacterized protein YggE
VTRSLIALLMLLSVAPPISAQTTPAPAFDGPTVVASGEGLVKRPPDRAWLQITAESRARSPREAQKLNTDVMSAVLQKLRGAGLTADAIQTRGYDLQPEFDYNNGRQTLRGYVARNSLEVRVDELGRVGELLDLAVTFGATSVGNVRFDLKDRAGAEREALRLAVEDARRRAEAAAAGAGMKVDRVLRIEEQRAVVPPPRPMMAMSGVRSAEGAGEPPIAAGELEVRANVTLVVAIR